ncbi:peptidoglycan bridge formation glycyltransferase FemA/FemB family protein [Treponema endosymbiont of Eucomonympha sp.]|uniref:peptidoglycan bridge formation glycyltransferase FemA/FemB family protein n=1 Tax=Treponema endosymbiont of Eucomonympha sp. TaxID=1580831 RepID=UPI0007511FEB|nr:peptidoglycan bridge formation glycyltransferase FemA/FemB family protein [Treponema endosymbiont of Eucomonympha sp.]
MIEYIEHSTLLKKLSICYGLTYFNEPYTVHHVDIIREWQYAQRHFFSTPFYTLCINLTDPNDTIFAQFTKNTKYEINRAIKQDGIVMKTYDANQYQEIFCDFFDEFAYTKNLDLIDRNEISRLVSHNMLTIRVALYKNNLTICHSYITANNRARLAQSASLFRESRENNFRNMLGRANRLLHWDDIQYFKKKGYRLYDFGGINKDLSNKETLAINKFKRCFGGTELKEYKSLIPVSIKGLVYLWAKKIWGKL